MKKPLFLESPAKDGGNWHRMWLKVRSLLHPPLTAHPNTVDLWAIGWERGLSSTSAEIEWPILVMPYASHGSLSDFQWLPELTRNENFNLCLNVALILKALHECEIAHGNLKGENVLIFAEELETVAKLCDFGCAITDAQPLRSLLGGSQPWNCPEWRERMGKDNLPRTDNYSFGLLVWRTLSENRRPFQDLQCFKQNHHLSMDDIDRLKRQPDDRFLTEVKNSLSTTFVEDTEKDLLEQLLDNTIRFLPRERSLDAAREKLENILQSNRESYYHSPTINFAPLQIEMVYDSQAARNLSWQHQVDIFEFHTARTASNLKQPNESDIRESSLLLFLCQVQGIGIHKDIDSACEHLLRSAEAGDPNARAISYRAITSLSESSLEQTKRENLVKWLCDSVAMGCFGAKFDFEHLIASQKSVETIEVFKELYGVAINKLRCFYTGVGANHFLNDRGGRLNPLSVEHLEKFESEIACYARENQIDINTFVVNSRGDRLLHFLSSCGFDKAICLLNQYFGERLDINSVNNYGETALLSAYRAGQRDTARILLENGADLRPSQSGENPLHWLSMFDLDAIRELTPLMFRELCETEPEAKHAELRRLRINENASTCKWATFWDSELPSGTPLHRAVYFKNVELVKILLDFEADPLKQGPGVDGVSALEMACIRHEAEIISAILHTLEIPINDIPVQPLSHLALLSYDELTSRLANGVNFELDLVKTVALLVDRGANPGLVDLRIPRSNAKGTALFKAALSNSPFSVKLALSRRLLPDSGFLDIRCEEKLLTPLHIAVQQGSLPIVDKLIDAGCDPTISAGSEYLTSTLHLCADMDSSSPHQLEILNRILPRFENVDQSNDGSETPFAIAVRLLKFDVALALLDKGADINFEFSKGGEDLLISEPTTILGLMVQQMNPAGVAAVQFLLGYDQHGRKKPDWKYPAPSPVVSSRWGTTVFHAIALRRCKPLYALDMVKEMMSYVSDTYGGQLDVVNARSLVDPRPAALHVAAYCTNIEIIDALLRLGADREAVDDESFTPMERAVAVMVEDLEVDESRGWTEAASRREVERRKAVYEMLGGSMDIFETAEVDELELITP